MSDINEAARALGSKGGKATAAQYAGHHEAWGSKGGKKAARALGKAGRAERARKGHETRKRQAEREAMIESGREAMSREPAESDVTELTPPCNFFHVSGMVCELAMGHRGNHRFTPRTAKERLAAGLCRRCLSTRYVDPKTGKTNALWCEEHRAIQLKQDKRSTP